MRAASGGGGGQSSSAWAPAGPDGGGAGLVAATVTSGEGARCGDTMPLAALPPPRVVVEVAPGAARAGVPGGNDARLVPSASRGACGRVRGVPAVGAGAPDSRGRFASHDTAAAPKAQFVLPHLPFFPPADGSPARGDDNVVLQKYWVKA